jgi:hypothetical protein
MAPKGWVKHPHTGEFVPREMVWVDGIRPKEPTAPASPMRSSTPAPRARAKASHAETIEVEAPVGPRPSHAPPPARKSRPSQSRKTRWCKALWSLWSGVKSLRKASSWLGMAVLIAVWQGNNSFLVELSKILGSVAAVTEASSGAVSVVLHQGTDLVTSASQAFQSVTASSLNTASVAWRGVDLVQLSGQRRTGRVLVEDASVLQAWLSSQTGRDVLGIYGQDVLQSWGQLAFSVQPNMPAAEVRHEELLLSGSYSAYSASAVLAWSGHVWFQFAVVNASFQPVWSNPFWELLECQLDSERDQIMLLVRDFSANIPEVNLSTSLNSSQWEALLSDEAVSQLQARRMARLWQLRFTFVFSTMYSRGGVGSMCGLFGLALGISLRFSTTARFRIHQGVLRLISSVRFVKETSTQYVLAAKEITQWVWDDGFMMCPAPVD